MTTTTYSAIRTRTPGVSFAATSGGATTTSGSLYFWVSCRNLGGFNQLSDGASTPTSSGVLVNWTAGQKVVATISSSAIASAEVFGIYEIVISAWTSDDHTSARRIGSVYYRDTVTVGSVNYPGWGATKTLPLTIEFTRDEHLIVGSNQIVATSSVLPSGTDEVQGMIRFVTADSKYYRLDAERNTGDIAATSGYWVEFLEGFSVYIADTTQETINGTQAGGCDRPVQGIKADFIPAIPKYTPDGSEQTYAPHFSVNNGLTADSGSLVVKGSRIAVRISQSGIDRSELFSSSSIGTLIGECTRSTGALDTSVDGAGSDVVLGDDELSSGLTGLSVPQDLARGNCLIYQVRLQVDASRFGGRIAEGDQLQVLLFNEGRLGYPSKALYPFGSIIFPSPSGRCRILPGATTGAKRLPGGGLVADDSVLISYAFNPPDSDNITGLATDTADQIIAISGKLAGDVTVRFGTAAVLSFEKIRAKVSTAPGTYTASDSTGAIAISGPSQSLSITVGYPSDANGVGTIRADYPDVIAGNTTGDFTAPELKVYVNKDGAGWQELSSTITVTPNTTQTFLITDISGASSVSLPDSSSDPTFGLWDYDSIAGSAVTSASSLASGSYEVKVGYHYPAGNSELTAITHNTSDGINIAEASISYGDLVAAAGNVGFTTTAADFTQPAVNSSVSVTVASADWISANQPLFVVGGGLYRASAPTSSTTVTLTNLGGPQNAAPSSTISSGAKVSPSGEAGSNGYGLNYEFDNGTSAGAATGQIRFNNSTLASATAIYLNETDADGLDATAIMTALNSNSGVVVWNRENNAIARFSTGGALTDNGGDRTIPVTYEASNGSFSDGDNVFISFALRGTVGPTPSLSIGTVDTGFGMAAATITGTAENPVLNLELPAGAPGPRGLRGLPGATPTFSIGTVEYGFGSADVTITGAPTNPALNFVLPQGERGVPGPKGTQGAKGDTGNPADPEQFINFHFFYG